MIEQTASAPNPSVGKRNLAYAVAYEVAHGARIESQSDIQVVVVRGRTPNHILHLLLTIMTFGFWLMVWAMVAILGGEKRTVLTLDEYGNLLRQ
jgi:hypothetical protein